MTYQSVNPADGKLLKKFDELTDRQLETKLAAAATCFETWRHKTYAERAVIVAKAAAILHAKADEFAHTMTLEMGKRINEARGEVKFSARYPRLLRQERRALSCAGEAPSDPRRSPYGEQPDRRDLRRGAVELSLLPACTGRRSPPDGRQCPGGEARRLRAAMRDRFREALDRGGRAQSGCIPIC